jgi:hypothetical protein
MPGGMHCRWVPIRPVEPLRCIPPPDTIRRQSACESAFCASGKTCRG